MFAKGDGVKNADKLGLGIMIGNLGWLNILDKNRTNILI
jgi:hypothetical protein